MPPLNPYSVPWLKLRFIDTYPVIDKLGFHNFFPFAALWQDVQQGETVRHSSNGTLPPVLFQVKNIPVPTKSDDCDVFSHVGFKGLYNFGPLPSLMLERNTGAVLLRPEPVLRSTPLDSTMSWLEASLDGDRFQPSDMVDIEGNDITWTSDEKEDVFREITLVPSPQGPASGVLPPADDDGSNLVGVEFNYDTKTPGTTGHTISSNFTLPESPSFYIAVRVVSVGAGQDGSIPSVWVNFGNDYAIGFASNGVVFSDTAGGGGKETQAQSISKIVKGPFLLDKGSSDKWYFVLVQTVSNAIVLQNAWEQIGDQGRSNPSTGWAYFRTANSYISPSGAQTTGQTTAPSGFVVPSANMYVTFSGSNAAFCFFPCQRCKHGTIEIVTPQPMGYTPDVINAAHGMYPPLNWKQTPEPSGDSSTDTPLKPDQPPIPPSDGNNLGFITTTIDKTTTTDSYTWSCKFDITKTIADGLRQDRSPELYCLSIDASPKYSNASFGFFLDTDRYVPQTRILRASIRLGVVDQEAEVTLDNRDGMFNGIAGVGTNKMNGVYPVQIECGWNRSGGVVDSTQKGIRMTGFCLDPGYQKKSDMSTVTLKIVGRKMQIEEAQAVNLPIYDGYTHLKVIKDLLGRSGYKYYDTDFTPITITEVNAQGRGRTGLTFIDDTFQLPMTLQGQSPIYNFTMGTSVWQCIQQIASTVGFWTFFDNKGLLHYVNPFKSNTSDQTFREIASDAVTSYDECYALSSAKETSQIRNAVMVIGLDKNYVVPNPITSIKKDDGTHGTDPLTTTTGVGYIPWYRWAFITDGRLNTPEITEWMANRVYQNSKNPRVTAKFRTWGKPTLFPLDMVDFNIRQIDGEFVDHATNKKPITDNIDLRGTGTTTPSRGNGALFRVLSVTDSFDFEKGSYWTDFETEFFDPAWGWASWWDPMTPNG